MLSFHNDAAIKEKYLSRVRAHQEADLIIKGQYWGEDEDGVFRGCAVGCTIEGYDHGAYERELGIPRILARLEDGIFEGLPQDRSLLWPYEFLEAIPVGVDLSCVWPKFAVWLLTDPIYGVIQYSKTDEQRLSIQIIADYYTSPKEITLDQWIAARKFAAYAAANAANATADAANAAYAAANAANSAADAANAAYAAANAADAYADADAYAAADATGAYADAKENHRIAQADKLLELFRELNKDTL